MHNRESILNKLKSAHLALNACGVKSIGLFGSFARNEHTSNSDIDILIDFEDGKENYDNLLAAYDVLEKLFVGKKIEIVTKNGLSPFIGPTILNEAQYV